VLVSAYVRLFRRRSQAEFADDLSALTVDIEHWQQKNTVVVCGDFNARIGRQGAESPTNSVVPQGEITRDARSYASGSHEHNGLYSLANRKAPRPDTRASALRGSRW
jgi:endonuclease/exonuclease/phosphatase family metal-dependent hydrolase